MDIFEEINMSHKTNKQQERGNEDKKISIKKPLVGVQKKQSQIKLARDAKGVYSVANPETISLTQEEVEKYCFVGYNEQRKERDFEQLYDANFLKRIEIDIRSKQIAKIIKKGSKCSERKKQKLKQKALKLLEKPVYSNGIAKAIAKQGFCDNLGIYAEIHNAVPGIFAYAYQIAKQKPNAQAFDAVIKYFSPHDFVSERRYANKNMLGELSLRQFEIVLEIMRRQGETIWPYSFRDLPGERVEMGLKMGVFVMNETWCDELNGTLQYFKDNEYFCNFCDELKRVENNLALNNTEQYLEKRVEQDKDMQFDGQHHKNAEEKIDLIFNEALKNLEKEI